LGLDSRRDDIAIRQQVGYVAERPALDEWMTVQEVGWFAAGFHAEGFLDNYLRQIAAFGVAESRLRQVRLGGANAVPNLDRFYYGRLGVAPEVRPAERFALLAEPLGNFVVNVEGMLAIVVGDHIYPLPVLTP
jgi:ABC-2 type transport system ATP-binding protein